MHRHANGCVCVCVTYALWAHSTAVFVVKTLLALPPPLSRTSHSSRITSCESSMCVCVWVYVTVMCHHPLSLSLAYCISVFSVYIFIANVAPKSRQAVRQGERETGGEGGKRDAWARQVAILKFFAFVYATLLHITQVAAKFIAFYCAFRQLLLSLCRCPQLLQLLLFLLPF